MKQTISNELTNSLKSGEKDRIHTLRLILAAIKDKEIASRSSGQDAIISDENIIQILKKMVKQRNDSIEMFDKAGRDELVIKEKNEISIINEFLPEQLSAEETLKLCEDAIQANNAETIKEIGKVIKYLRENSPSSLDMAIASKILREKLQK
tara:strand:+ start:69 stop:524 length:456 start_codon:yes stop_codon:yes gene_type:complete